MANRPNTKRNDEIVRLHDTDPVKYSFAVLAARYKIAKSTVHEIYLREKARGGDKKAISSGTVKGKYPGMKKL